MRTSFKYEKTARGESYNDVLSIKDKIAPHQTVDRMAGVRFELGEQAIDARKSPSVFALRTLDEHGESSSSSSPGLNPLES